jgi:CRP/FNR family transcriptional regulator, dissimilatory nitrate respiration regulator
MPVKTSPDILPFLDTIPYFQNLEQKTLQEVVRGAFFRAYEVGQIVLLEGEQTVGLYIVQEGSLKVSKIGVDGREQILQFLDAGEVFNAISVFTGQSNPATVSALEPSKVWLIRRETILKMLDTHPHFARRVIQELAGRVLHLISLVEDLSLRSVEARLARLLLEHSVGDKVQRRRWATQTEIASRLGTVPDVVSRTLRKLVDQGLIQMNGKDILLIDREGLEAIAKVEP